MTTSPNPIDDQKQDERTERSSAGDTLPRDATNWAQQATRFSVSRVPTGALNLNIEGRQGLSPLQGFGQMWQKTYRIRLVGATETPGEVIKAWKENFPRFWPKGNFFHAPLTGIKPGEVAILRIVPGGMPLSTGVLVLYADDESFTLMTPQGHVFAGWITFSAYEEDGCTVAQTQVLMRASDPMYEFGLRFGGHKAENKFWEHTLKTLAASFGVVQQPVLMQVTCVDPKIQWSEVRNIWYNSALRTMMYTVTVPFRRVRGRR